VFTNVGAKALWVAVGKESKKYKTFCRQSTTIITKWPLWHAWAKICIKKHERVGHTHENRYVTTVFDKMKV
jgi:hypothetical protein